MARARARADELGFERSSEPEVGRLLHLLAAQRGRMRVGEIGTGTGVGAAWIASALAPSVPFVTVELDAERATAAAELFAEDENVHVLEGDWHELMPAEAPFDLLFYDGGGKQRPDIDGEQVVGLLAPGGTIVLDDLTPNRPAAQRPVRVSGPVEGVWGNREVPPATSSGRRPRSGPDPVREFWLGHPRLAAAELHVSSSMAVIVGVRVL